MDVPAVANVLGTVGAICWSVQLIPQIIINYRRHNTTGLQPTMMLLWASAGIPLGVYNIVQSFNIALQIQPQILTVLSLITWLQCKYYDPKSRWSWQKCVVVAIPLCLVMGGIETGLVFGLRQATNHDLDWPVILMAILSAVLLCTGVLRHYWDIYKEQTVRGISFLFVAIDALGDLTSLVSVLFQPRLDVRGLVIYGSELFLWLGVFACGGWFNVRPRIKPFFMSKSLQNSGTERCNNSSVDHCESSEPRITIEEDQMASSTSSTVFRTASGRSSQNEIRLRPLNNHIDIGHQA